MPGRPPWNRSPAGRAAQVRGHRRRPGGPDAGRHGVCPGRGSPCHPVGAVGSTPWSPWQRSALAGLPPLIVPLVRGSSICAQGVSRRGLPFPTAGRSGDSPAETAGPDRTATGGCRTCDKALLTAPAGPVRCGSGGPAQIDGEECPRWERPRTSAPARSAGQHRPGDGQGAGCGGRLGRGRGRRVTVGEQAGLPLHRFP